VRLNFVVVTAIGLASALFGLVQVATARPETSACELPRDLQSVIESKYPGRTVVDLSDLGDDDKGFFQKAHGDACPGMVKVDFYSDGKPTLALALTTKSVAKGRTELVVAHQIGAIWKTVTLETTPGDAPVVWSEKPGEYKDVYGEKSIRATGAVIIFCRYEAWTILYAWTNNRMAKIWVMD
jgi:hypothetical protein